MADLVGTCPKGFWEEWLAEGDAAGDDHASGEEWGWYTGDLKARSTRAGDRFYVVAHGKLRGFAPVVRVDVGGDGHTCAIMRRGGAVACTLSESIPGFRGLRLRWWNRDEEMPFPDWKTP
jgi:hypothetical protein